jgi:hypothetical protein
VAHQMLIFTALPDGPDAPVTGPLRLSVFVSPRLSPDSERGRLDDFPDVVDWPATVAAISWEVLLDGAAVPATVVTAPAAVPSSDLWDRLFPPDLLVRARRGPDYDTRPVQSYPQAEVLASVRGLWSRALAESPTRVPGTSAMIGILERATGASLDRVREVLRALADPTPPRNHPAAVPPDQDEREEPHDDIDHWPGIEELDWRLEQEEAWLAGQRAGTASMDDWLALRHQRRQARRAFARDTDPAEYLRDAPGLVPLYAARDFHAPSVVESDDAPQPYVPPALREQDFHDRLAMLGSHPAVLRRLGLVVDLELDVHAPFQGAGSRPWLQVRPVWTARPPSRLGASPVRQVLPRTLLDPTPGVFRAAPLEGPVPRVLRGWIPLKRPGGRTYSPVVVDPDGAALKTVAAAEALVRRMLWRRAGDGEGGDGLPTLRSAGISIAMDDRAGNQAGTFARAQQHEDQISLVADGVAGASAPELDAEDITRGWRVDVRDTADPHWHSLHLRRGAYTVEGGDGGPPISVDADEGMITPTATGSGDAGTDPGGVLRQAESLFLWDGWSLAVPRPGTPIDGTDQVAAPADTGPLPLRWDFRAEPGTLPSLRFGRDYVVRLRAVDLAGNSPTPAAGPADDPGTVVSEPVRYLRFDPVPPPDLVPRAPRGPGESPHDLVLRSTHDHLPHPETSERHVVPPRTSQLAAEQHGMFDMPSGVGRLLDPGAHELIAAREAATYADAPGARRDPSTPRADDAPTPDADDPGEYYLDADDAPMDYLPDPMARGAALRGLPATTGTVLVGFDPAPGGRWPDARPFRLLLREGPRGHRWYSAQRLLVVWLPKADVLVVEVSSYLDPADLSRLGVWQWFLDSQPDPRARDRLARAAARGNVWLLTPPRRVTMVHAVHQPLVRPVVSRLAVDRAAGESSATLHGSIRFSRKSTGQVDLESVWTEPVDLGHGNVDAGQGHPEVVPDPFTTERRDVFVLPLVDRLGSRRRLAVVQQHDFGDTKARTIRYRATATSAFLAYFLRTTEVDVPDDPSALITVDPEGIAPGTLTLTDATTGAVYAERTPDRPDGVFTLDPDSGTVRFGDIPVGERPSAGSRLRARYTYGRVTRTSPWREVVVPASARPAPPKVLSVIPTFGWDQAGQDAATGIESRRVGRGLRVYLDRPWWSSGEHEKLAVVLLNDAFTETAETRTCCTQWGDDPLNRGYGEWLYRRPTVANFPESEFRDGAADGTESGDRYLRLEELPYRRVDVAPYTVRFDTKRKLWFADITVEPGPDEGAYMPFVRLALARYQRQAPARFKLSRVAVADFVQLGVDRTAAALLDADARVVTVTLTGVWPQTARGTGNRLLVRVESRLPDVSDELLAWEDSGVSVEQQLRPSDEPVSLALELPAPAEPGMFRLVVEEFEDYVDGPERTQARSRPIYLDVLPV